ncbi:hypothetical protein F4679DRAFT_599972 [Xylaria curta]|nr:hypothetical protein F4679DRAFT_599972 [Xylaria curta]
MSGQDSRTTWGAYLQNWHEFYKSFTIGTKPTAGENTDLTDKFCPQFLKAWPQWSTHHQANYQMLRIAFGDKKLFTSFHEVAKTQWRINNHKNSEGDAEEFEKRGVAEIAQDVVNDFLETSRRHSQEFNFTKPRFQWKMASYYLKPPGTNDLQERKIIPDVRAFITDLSNNTESLTFVGDYKAAHKLCVEVLRTVLQNSNIFMEVVNRKKDNKTVTDPTLVNEHKQQLQIAMALIQVYDYMIIEGVKYGYLANGNALVLLYVDLDNEDPTSWGTLYYHLCIPNEDVHTNDISHTAVAQLATFYLHTLSSRALTHSRLDDHRKTALTALERWPNHYDDYTEFITAVEDTSESSQDTSHEPDSPYDEHQSKGRSKTTKAQPKSKGKGCNPSENLLRDDEDDVNDGNKDKKPPRAPTLPQTTVGQKRKQDSTYDQQRGPRTRSEHRGSVDSGPLGDYCTQACLLSLKRGGNLDKNCPNVSLHYTAAGGYGRRLDTDESSTRHPVQFSLFTRLVEEQLHQNLFRYCMALDHYGFLGKTGAIGTLFKVELAPYGYIFVGKGVRRPVHVSRLQHESQVYSWLEKLQGWVIPVHLGIVNLPEPRGYSLPGGYAVFHMLLMSWAGEMASAKTVSGYQEELDNLTKKVWYEGVSHEDERMPNVLWNQERNGLMLIDFDCAVFRQPVQHTQITKLVKTTKKRRPANDIPKSAPKRVRISYTPRVLNPDGKSLG